MKIDRNISQINSYQKVQKKEQNRKTAFNAFIDENKNELEAVVNSQIKLNDFKESSKEYDIKNATYKEFNSICNVLYKSKKISLFERGVLTFNPTKSSQWSKITKDKLNTNYYLTNTNDSGKRNWIVEFENRIERQRKMGNSSGADSLRKALEKVKENVCNKY